MAKFEQGPTIQKADRILGDELTGRPDGEESDGFSMTDEEREILERVRMFWDEARIEQAEHRYEMALDEDFYDGLQWSVEDELALRERGQAPIVINEIKPMIDWVVGTEKRTKIDYRVLPRKNRRLDQIAARAKSQLLKYVQDVCYGQMENSTAFKDEVVAGMGWMEIGIRGDKEDDPIFMRAEDWRNMWYDYRCRSRSMDDCRYVIRAKWMDLDIAIAMFPEKADELRHAARTYDAVLQDEFQFDLNTTINGRTSGARQWVTPAFQDDFSIVNNRRKIVRIMECWYRHPVRETVVRGGFYDGVRKELVDEATLEYEIRTGAASLADSVAMRVHYAIFTGNILLKHGRSPYFHNHFPFVMIPCYRRKRDGAPYGMVRNVRGVQEDLNKRRSKALHILSTNRIIAEANAASPQGWAQIEEEIARPDAIIKLDGKPGARFEVNTDNAVAQQHLQMMADDVQAIREVGGVTNENLGQESNAVSGKAILAKQNEGSVVTAEIFDNYRFAQQLQGEILLSLIEQFYTEEKSIYVAGNRGRYAHTTINRVEPDGTVLNDITAAKSDFIVAEQDFRESLRISMFESMSDLITKLDPQIAFNLLDLVIDMSDIPDKDDLVERIRALNGQKPPSDDAGIDIHDKLEPSPDELEEQKAEEQQKQLEAEIQRLELEMKRAGVRKELADAVLKEAKAATERAKAKKSITDAKVSEQAHNIEMGAKMGLIKTADQSQTPQKKES